MVCPGAIAWGNSMWRTASATRPAGALVAVGLALMLSGCAPMLEDRLDRRAEVARAAYPPTGPLLSVGGATVHVHVQGQGPDLILLHGASGNSRDFTFALVDRLARHYRVFAFDRPGLGWSQDLADNRAVDPANQVRVLRAAAQRLGASQPVILGHSYGAAVALAWALEAPAETRGLVLVSGASMPWPGGLGLWYPLSASRIGGATIVPLIAAYADPGRAEDLLARIFAPQPVPKGYVDHIGVELALRPDQIRANSRQVNGLKPYLRTMSRRYADLTLPVEIIHGTADRIVPIAIHSEPLARLLPQARLTRLDGIGHMPHHTNPEAILAAVDRIARR